MFGAVGTSAAGFSQLGGVENSFMAGLNPMQHMNSKIPKAAEAVVDTSFNPQKSMFKNMLENANRSASNSVRSAEQEVRGLDERSDELRMRYLRSLFSYAASFSANVDAAFIAAQF